MEITGVNVKKTRLAYLLPSLFTIVTFIWLIVELADKPRLLVIYTGSQNSEFNHQLQGGVNKTLSNERFVNLRQYFFWFGQRSPDDISCRQLRYMFDWKPKAVVVFGAEAQQYIDRCYLKNTKFNFVFSQLERSPIYTTYKDYSNLTGQLNTNIYSPLIDMIKNIYRNKVKRVYYIADSSSRSQYIETLIKNTGNWKLIRYAGNFETDSFSKWKQTVLNAKKQTDLLLVGNMEGLKDKNKVVPPNVTAKWTIENSPVPVIGLTANLAEYAPITYVVSRENIAESVTELAIHIIKENQPAGKVPVNNDEIFKLYINKELFEKLSPDVSIPPLYITYAKSSGTFVE